MAGYTETEVLERQETETLLLSKLIVHNDNYNTFEHVIETLIMVCKHNPEQAEQCAYIIHHKGKCSVKTGEYDSLVSMKDMILDRGISATIET